MLEKRAAGEELIDHAMRQMILLLVIALVGYSIARLLVHYFSMKMKGPDN